MKKLIPKIFIFFYFLIYLILIAVSGGIFYIFRPFTYIDNNKSYLICEKGNSYIIGPNLVYSFSGKLDNFNDKKARKVCEYGVIRDYGDTFKTPLKINYTFYPITSQESSWLQSCFAFLLSMIFGTILIETLTIPFSFLAFKKNHITNTLFGKRLLKVLANLITR